MLYPSIDRLMKLADSKYTLVVAAAKRARQLQDGAEKLVKVQTNKNVTVALNEIAEEKIKFVRTKEGIK
ncbi:DNA-directed RNA polymerase subunit omega [Collibacillus ludicampi]|jgi:DNA-directed RNA polymerase subunit omega|uniref:DNA-directed RNA polymerase subunit omega n=1 Tax=Collibacillus ludicampi TaxID=2771369 RepID=A0AAV4LIF0_9BACL|nr:DNA-directed RNA polymerase subunit omega [Collibacillus ludicampi]GIM47524.1 DNA-directed RNA polymerase subunit omega [Collibacillus ludicampi]